jgi:ATP-dependent DNA helicase RecQ
MEAPRHILKQYWGYDAFRPLQEEIVQAVLDKRDVVALLPTGGGKSICFQVPALMLPGICVVISPLIALMKDQVEQLKSRGIEAVAIFSGMSKRQIDIALDNCVFGTVKFLYVSPERLKTEIFLERFKRMKVSFVAIDEAHCISQWGYDFRPPYLEIALLRNYHPQLPFMALTASATPEVKEDIMAKLEMKEVAFFQKSFARENLSYSVRFVEDKMVKLLQIVRSVPGTAVVYVRNRKLTQETAQFLQRNKISADYYHAGLSNDLRNARQDAWIKGSTRVIVATNAFGMGIDKPDVRVVVHLDMPDSLEAYYQEAGRAGRDGRKAYAVILAYTHDTDELRQRALDSYPPKEFLVSVYKALGNYFQLAIGTAEGQSFDFDVVAFAKRFDFPPMRTYHALVRLEELGFIQLSESFYRPSTLIIHIGQQELYDLQLKKPALDSFFKGMLRLYGGELFTYYTKISERKLAQQLGISEQEVKNILVALHKGKVIEYLEQKEVAQLTYVLPRLDADNLPINKKAYEGSQQKYLKRIDAVIHYVQHPKRCRTQMILAYFGEEAYDSCGVCDHCLERRQALQQQEVATWRAQIHKALGAEPMVVEELVDRLGLASSADFLELLREMVDAGELAYDDKWRLHLHLGEGLNKGT